MKLALIGYGKMGQVVDRVAHKAHIEVVAKISTHETPLTPDMLTEADVCIDFSHPDIVLKHVGICCAAGKDVVVGTTGWYDHLDSVKSLAQESNVGVIWAANFSLGMHLFDWLVKEAGRLFKRAPGYDVAGYEIHHSQKGDSPSGSAQRLVNTLLEELPEKKKARYEQPKKMIMPEEINFGSIRCGHHPGTHTILFDSIADTIELTHRARNREGFGLGAVMAAQWILGRKGLFHLDDMIDLLMKEER